MGTSIRDQALKAIDKAGEGGIAPHALVMSPDAYQELIRKVPDLNKLDGRPLFFGGVRLLVSSAMSSGAFVVLSKEQWDVMQGAASPPFSLLPASGITLPNSSFIDSYLGGILTGKPLPLGPVTPIAPADPVIPPLQPPFSDIATIDPDTYRAYTDTGDFVLDLDEDGARRLVNAYGVKWKVRGKNPEPLDIDGEPLDIGKLFD